MTFFTTHHAHSNNVNLNSGVIQGSVIGPLLFSIYINDLPNVVQIGGVDLEIFADDTKLYSSDIAKLQQAVNSVSSWCDQWSMKLAPEKSVLLVVDRALSSEPVDIIIDGISVPQKSSVRDLGIIINNRLDPSDHCLTVVKDAQRLSGLITRTLRTKKLSVYKKAFVSLVRPKLEYATQIWSPHTIRDVNMIENVQRAFTRRAFYKCRLDKASYSARLRHLDLPTLETRRIKCDLIMTYKIANKLTDFPESAIFRRSVTKTRGHAYKLQSTLPVFNDVSKNCFSNRSVGLWNNLPHNIVQAPSLQSFKRMLLNLDISSFFVTKIRG